MESAELVHAIQRIESIPSPSFTLDRILELASDCESDIERLGEAIEADPAVTARVLRLANSTYFGVPGEVTSVLRSIVVVGYKNVLSLATCAALAPAFRGDDAVIDRDALWRHACATAEAARVVASHSSGEPALAHVAGLLHDFGIIVLSEALGDDYGPVWEAVRHDARSLAAVERDRLGIDHGTAAGILFERWALPPSLTSAVVLHERPGEESSGLAAIVAVAARVAARAGYAEPSGGGPEPRVEADARAVLGISPSLQETIEAEFGARREAVDLILGAGTS